MKRRSFILYTSATIIASSGFFYLQTNKVDNLPEYIKSLSGLDELGEKYKKNNKAEIEYLRLLESKIEQYTQVASYNDKISLAINEDFRNNNICNIDGWQLSQTECLLAAAFVSFEDYVKPTIIANHQNFKNAKVENFLNIKKWGPQKTLRNIVFNQQSDGHAGLWFVVDNPPPNLRVVIDGKKKSTFINEKSITSGIHLDELKLFINKVGKSEITIYDSINNRKQIVGYFEVLPSPEKLTYADGTKSKVFCPIEKWGPKKAERNTAFNKQPNGEAAIWIKTKCAPKTVTVLINGLPIKTTVKSNFVTASVSIENIKTNNDYYEVKLYDKVTNETLPIGKIKIQ